MIDVKSEKQPAGAKALADKIAAAIRDSGLTAREVAKNCNVTPQAVNGWKTTGRISKDMLATFASVVRLPVQHFISTEQQQQNGEFATQGSESKSTVLRAIDSGDYVSAREIVELIDLYAKADGIGRDMVLKSARAAAKRASGRIGSAARKKT